MTVRMIELDLVSDAEFEALSRLRRGIGDLFSFLQATASSYDCSVALYQMLLALKTSRHGDGTMDIGMVATALRVRHPSAAEMVRKAESQGFVATSGDPDDARRVLVQLTELGVETVTAIAAEHAVEVRRQRAAFISALTDLA